MGSVVVLGLEEGKEDKAGGGIEGDDIEEKCSVPTCGLPT